MATTTPDNDTYSRTVRYDTGRHWSVVVQKFGSMYSRVLPFCLINLVVTCVILILLYFDVDVTISGT